MLLTSYISSLLFKLAANMVDDTNRFCCSSYASMNYLNPNFDEKFSNVGLSVQDVNRKVYFSPFCYVY